MSTTSIVAQSREAKEHVKQVHEYLKVNKASIIMIGQHLAALKDDNLWRKAYGDIDQSQTWNEFVKYEFRVSPSYASRSMDVWNELKKRLGISDRLIVEADQQVLYSVLPIVKRDNPPKEVVEDMLRMDRAQFSQEVNGCEEHNLGEETYKRCIDCNSFKRV